VIDDRCLSGAAEKNNRPGLPQLISKEQVEALEVGCWGISVGMHGVAYLAQVVPWHECCEQYQVRGGLMHTSAWKEESTVSD
jgi:hypothetical protein